MQSCMGLGSEEHSILDLYFWESLCRAIFKSIGIGDITQGESLEREEDQKIISEIQNVYRLNRGEIPNI